MLALIKREPVMFRALAVAILDVLVVAGIVDVGVAAEVEAAGLAVVSVLLGVQVRNQVTPVGR